jgi:hypothetical protein
LLVSLLVSGATAAVTVSGSVYQGMDATGVEAATIAASTWDFGEGYMRAAQAGTTIIEHLYALRSAKAEPPHGLLHV